MAERGAGGRGRTDLPARGRCDQPTTSRPGRRHGSPAAGPSLAGSKVAVLVAAFKPDSDDIRDSPALNVAGRLHLLGAHVTVHDPRAMDNARRAADAELRGPVLDAAGAPTPCWCSPSGRSTASSSRPPSPAVATPAIVDGRNAWTRTCGPGRLDVPRSGSTLVGRADRSAHDRAAPRHGDPAGGRPGFAGGTSFGTTPSQAHTLDLSLAGDAVAADRPDGGLAAVALLAGRTSSETGPSTACCWRRWRCSGSAACSRR